MKHNFIKIIGMITVTTVGVLLYNNRFSGIEAEIISEDNLYQTDTGLSTEESKKPDICFYICGAVKNPDIYYLPEGSRVADAVDAAGGITDEGDPEKINLARVLSDGERIYIPRAGEESEGSALTRDGRINLNNATKEELKMLPGIGDSKAELIYVYIKENGPLTSTEQLMEISGIKEGVYSKIKDLVTVN